MDLGLDFIQGGFYLDGIPFDRLKSHSAVAIVNVLVTGIVLVSCK